jgi:acyl-CoA thioester hydrolase
MQAIQIKPYSRKVYFYETDQMGIVHHSNYIRWLEESRIDFMEQIGYGYTRVSELGIDFAVLGVNVDYKQSVRFNDVVEIHLTIGELTSVRMSIKYKILCNGILCATGETRHCAILTQKKKVVSLQKEIPELFDLFQMVFIV